MMIWLKSCPKCDGDLYGASDLYGDYVACLQCGHYLTQSEEIVVRYAPYRPARKAVAGSPTKRRRTNKAAADVAAA